MLNRSIPNSLLNICINNVSENIEKFIIRTENGDVVTFRWYDENIFLCPPISDRLLELLFAKKKSFKNIFLLFGSLNVQLKCLRLNFNEESKHFICQDFSFLNEHKLIEVHLINAQLTDFNNLSAYLNVNHLKKLHLNFCTPCESPSVIVEVIRFVNLVDLDISKTKTSDNDLKLIVDNLHRLQRLNISQTSVTSLEPLKLFSEKLKALSLYDVQLNNCDSAVSIISSLKELQLLDISSGESSSCSCLAVILLQYSQHWPLLEYLDISGCEDVVEHVLR